jgi:glycosyltransferase involved in cell wall biosynthesis
MSESLISVITPTFNYGHVIGEALDSLIAQSHKNWECIVVDDESTDDTMDVLAEYVGRDPRIRYWRQSRTGPVTARNIALASARGQYIQFLDADDLLEDEKLELHANFLDANRDVQLVYGEVRYFSETPTRGLRYSMLKIDKDWMPRVSGTDKAILMDLVQFNIMSFNAALFRRSAIDEVGSFDDGKAAPVADWDYLVRCAVMGHRFEFRNWPKTMTLMRWHPTSMSADRRYMLRATLRFREKLRTLVNDDALRRENDRLYGQEEGELGIEEVANGQTMAGIYHLLRAVWFASGFRAKQAWAARAALALFVRADSFKRVARGSLSIQLRNAVSRSLLRRAT